MSGEHQSKLTLMSESLRNDGRIWVPKSGEDKRDPREIPEQDRDYYLERIYPSFGNLVPRDIASRAAKNVCDEGRGVGPGGLGVYLDFADAIARLGRTAVEAKYGNLFNMYARSQARTRTRHQCESIRPCTTRWVGSGSTTTCRPAFPDSMSPVKPTSPTTGRTDWAPAP